MPHTHIDPGQHDNTVCAYIVRLDTTEPSLFIHQHKRYKKWLPFGGHVELKENPWQAIIHELREESGYDINQLKVLQPPLRLKQLTGVNLHPYPVVNNTHIIDQQLGHFHTDISYAFITNQAPRHQANVGESLIMQSFTAEELRAIPNDQIFEDGRETGLFILEKCLLKWEAIDSSSWVA